MTPSDRQFRAPLITRKPEIVGFQSALVIKDKGGPEIEVDDLGRILVQFYWDRKKKPSRRVRVAQFWAGSHRGALFVPRVGDEVLIQYEEGDPDRPIVIGSVYNGTNTVPTTLPDKKTHSGILTRSSTGGNGYNMLLFDDTTGSERVKMRSQKDLMFKALNNEQRDILNSQTENIGQDETINVGFPAGSGNFTLNAFQSATINVGPKGMPMTQIKMDTSSITLSVGPAGVAGPDQDGCLGRNHQRDAGLHADGPAERNYDDDADANVRDRAGGFYFAGHHSDRNDRRRHGRPIAAAMRNRRCRRASASFPRAMFLKRSRIWGASWHRPRTIPPLSTMRARSWLRRPPTPRSSSSPICCRGGRRCGGRSNASAPCLGRAPTTRPCAPPTLGCARQRRTSRRAALAAYNGARSEGGDDLARLRRRMVRRQRHPARQGSDAGAARRPARWGRRRRSSWRPAPATRSASSTD